MCIAWLGHGPDWHRNIGAHSSLSTASAALQWMSRQCRLSLHSKLHSKLHSNLFLYTQTHSDGSVGRHLDAAAGRLSGLRLMGCVQCNGVQVSLRPHVSPAAVGGNASVCRSCA